MATLGWSDKAAPSGASFQGSGLMAGTPKAGPNEDLGAVYSDYNRLFAPAQAKFDPDRIARNLQLFMRPGGTSTIKAPTARAAQIELPGGTFENYQKAIYESQFAPVSAELQRQQALGERQLRGQLAQSGLAESGAGIAQSTALARDFGARGEAAARDISNAATVTAYNGLIAVASANAQMRQEVALANAGFDLTAQTENARNLLNGQFSLAGAYVNALGISADAAAKWRDSFLSYLGYRESSALARDRFREEAAAGAFNRIMQMRAMDQRDQELSMAADANRAKLALDKTTAAQNFAAAMANIAAQPFGAAAGLGAEVRGMGLAALKGAGMNVSGTRGTVAMPSQGY